MLCTEVEMTLTITKLDVRRELGEMLDVHAQKQIHGRCRESTVKTRNDAQVGVGELGVELRNNQMHQRHGLQERQNIRTHL